MSEQTVSWLADWFRTHSGLDVLDPIALRGESYFDAGLIDSFGVIELIGDVEAHFGVEFSDRDFQDRRFATIDGLAEMIEGLQEGGHRVS